MAPASRAHQTRRSRGRAPEPPESGSAAADREPEPESVARAIALRQRTAAPRSRAQLETAMARRQVPDDVAGRVLDRLTEVGLVDDEAYAESLVRTRHADRGLARRALAHELRAKGISPEVTEGALDGLGAEQERATARSLVVRKASSTAGLDPRRRRRRLAGMLARKGYPPSLALAVVDEVLDAEGADDDAYERANDDLVDPMDPSDDGLG